jgi:hypothetical protein
MTSAFYDYVRMMVSVHEQNELGRNGRYDEYQDRLEYLAENLTEDEFDSIQRISGEIYRAQTEISPRKKALAYDEAIHSFVPDDVYEMTAEQVWEGYYV